MSEMESLLEIKEENKEREDQKTGFNFLDAISGLMDRAVGKKKKILPIDIEDEKDSGTVTGAIGMMGFGSMMQELAKPAPEKEAENPERPKFKTVDVVVVGAGLAGLSAAYYIHNADRGIDMVVLEAKDRVGGRLHTKEMKAKDGVEFYDFGWQWVSSSHKHIWQLIDKLELQTYEQKRRGKTFFQQGEEKMVLLPRDTKPFGMVDNYDFNSLVQKLEALRKSIPLQDPTQCKNAKELDTITLQHFVDENTWFEAPRRYFETLVLIAMGVSPREMSLLFFLFALCTAGGWDALFGTEEGCVKQHRIKGGSQRICDILAGHVDHSKVKTKDPVVSIDQTDEHLVSVKTSSGFIYKASRVVVTIPPKYASRIEFTPPMPPERQNILERMPAGGCMIFVITYEEAFWRRKGKSGEILRVVDEDLAKTDRNSIPFSAITDATSMDNNPAIMGYVHAPFWLTEPESDRRDAILVGLKSYYGIEALDYVEYKEVDWSNEPYISCHPSCAMTPGAITNYFHSLLKTFDRVHWAGAETASIWYGHMEGAVLSGKRAAKEVMSHIRPDIGMDYIDNI
ncbi:probable flavin-containing monoamine oxidase A isoform X2 [Amphiura filiformis]|uniref:probable flavin-containing monoamine oxidase A isoform X2 n=1 Tax=Amphiura filiformis TaxID=82378 RepID=UPI003B224DDF